MKKYLDYFLNYPIQFLLSTSLTSLMFITIVEEINIIIYPMMIGYNIIAFMVYFKVLELKKKGVILYSVIAVLYFGICYLGSLDDVSVLFVMLAAVFFLSSVVFYFTINRMRIPVVTLILFIVYTYGIRSGLFYKTPVFLFSILLYFGLYVVHGQIKDGEILEKKNRFIRNKIIFSFCFITFFVGYLIPKPAFLPRLPLIGEIQGLLTDYGVEGSSISAFTTLNNSSRRNINTSVSLPDKTPIYTVKSDEPLYLRVKSYSNFLNDTWIEPDENNTSGYGINKYDYYGGVEKKARIQSLNFVSEGLYLTTGNTKMVETTNKNNKVYYALNGSVFTPKNNLEQNESYELTYYSESGFNENLPLNLDDPIYKDMRRIYTRFNGEEEYEKVYELSKSITGNEEGLYKKAKKIESYLRSGEYKYSLEVDKTGDDEDFLINFLFESKRGYCVQFASAMTMLCQAQGIPARYVEGFVASNPSTVSDGEYTVTLQDAHSYVEVFFPGYGWKIFDPTPSRMGEVAPEEGGKTSISSLLPSKINGSVVIFFIGAVFLYIIYILIHKNRFKIRNKLFFRKVKYLTPNKGVNEILPYLVKELERNDYPMIEGKTLKEYETILKMYYSLDISIFVNTYYRLKYEEMSVSKEIYEDILLEFKEILNTL